MTFKYKFDDEDFEFEVAFHEIKEALCGVILHDCDRHELMNIILEMDSGVEKYFEDELASYFEDEAYEAFKDAKEYEKDPLGYNGLSIKDFI